MADAEIHADFDRDGKLSLSKAEYAARSSGPGAVLGINVDRDGRSLPAAVHVEKKAKLDFELPTKSGADNDLLAITIVVSAAAVASFASLRLAVSGPNAGLVALIDDKARVVPPAPGPSGVLFPLPLKAGKWSFRLEASRIPGSPLAAKGDTLVLSILGFDQQGHDTTIDSGRFMLAPFIVMGDTSPAERLYMASLPLNQAAVADVKAALAGISPAVSLHLIDAADCANDAWIQDQFQLGYTATPAGAMRAILHLPRLRRNTSIDRYTKNVGDLVRTHFPSTNLGLIDDFWQRQLIVRHQAGTKAVPFVDSVELFVLLNQISRASVQILAILADFCSKAAFEKLSPAPTECGEEEFIAFELNDLPQRRQQLPKILQKAGTLARRLERAVSSDDADVVRAKLAFAQATLHELDHVLRVVRTDRFELVSPFGTFVMDGQQLKSLDQDVSHFHDSLNFGGNVEASPPFAGFPYGKVVLGTSDEREMDPALFRFFATIGQAQPVVKIDTSWLEVGHVDELMTFVPDLAAKKDVLLRVSPDLAQELLDAVRALYRSGLDEFNHAMEFGDPWVPPRISRHQMRLGKNPVTRMFRGKFWLHSHPSPRKGGPASTEDEVSEPPAIYRRLVRFYDGEYTRQNAPFITQHPLYDEHEYRAALSTFELEFWSGESNEDIEDDKMDKLEATLGDAFPGFAILKLPVFFDFTRKLGEARPISAFTPNLVNLQLLNGTVLIPNPYGPRLLPDDAVKVVQQVLAANDQPSAAKLVKKTFFTSQKLDVVEIWLEGKENYEGRIDPLATVEDLAEEFLDGFPPALKKAEIAKKIQAANPGAFNPVTGRLNAGLRKIRIPENTVDVFQAYTHALLTSLGLKVRWIDSWFYHVRAGEIHCGTNVLRKVPAVKTPWWTQVPAPPGPA